MGHQYGCGPEERLFDALGEVFELEQEEALDVSKRAACSIASFVADVGALSGSPVMVSTALARIQEIQVELTQLTEHLVEIKSEVSFQRIH
ncbi:MAG: hypothetical protein AAGM21_06765 [Pseudomonadota bacterium]